MAEQQASGLSAGAQGSALRSGTTLLKPGLPFKLLMLTILFVMLAEVLIYVPSVANFRRSWLNDKLAAAQVAALVLEGAARAQDSQDQPSQNEESLREGLPAGLEMKLLDGIGLEAIAVRVGGARRLLSRDGMPPVVSRTVDMRNMMWTGLVMDAFDVLLRPVNQPIRVIDNGMGSVEFVEIIVDEQPLRKAMLGFSVNILLVSLLISGLTAGLVYLTLHRMIVRPVKRLAASVMAFEADPENPDNVIRPSTRRDEIGDAERAVGRMQLTLAEQLRQKQHLAALGLAVSKISHDLRNMLASAQLLSDRLTETADPQVQRFAPKLIATLARAIGFCQSTLAYGRASESLPVRQAISLHELAGEVAEMAGAGPGHAVELANAVPDGLIVQADPDHMMRILLNLMRNAVQSMLAAPQHDMKPRLTITAMKDGQQISIDLADNGPGVPERAKAHLFKAFLGSVRAGGTGLGLAIASELVRLNGGDIALMPSETGAVFRITLPLNGSAGQGR
jgi:signal transduction histidine kinase